MTRPTTDRVRESLFNVLAARTELAGAVVLDLYAGSGALGLEALSRGADSVIFVEADHRAAAVIAQNIDTLAVTAAATVRRADVVAALSAGPPRPVDLVLADPPYDLPGSEVEAVLVALAEHGWAGPGTVAAVERRAAGGELRWPHGWTRWPSRRYGGTRIELAQLVC